MNTDESIPQFIRPPASVIVLTMMWSWASCVGFIIWIEGHQLYFLGFSVLGAVFTAIILKGYRWAFWFNLGVCSLSLGMSFLQLQIPSWSFGTPTVVIWCRVAITVWIILSHEFPSLQRWFGVKPGGRRWHVGFWLLVGGLVVLGQFLLPLIKSLNASSWFDDRSIN